MEHLSDLLAEKQEAGSNPFPSHSSSAASLPSLGNCGAIISNNGNFCFQAEAEAAVLVVSKFVIMKWWSCCYSWLVWLLDCQSWFAPNPIFTAEWNDNLPALLLPLLLLWLLSSPDSRWWVSSEEVNEEGDDEEELRANKWPRKKWNKWNYFLCASEWRREINWAISRVSRGGMSCCRWASWSSLRLKRRPWVLFQM